MNKKPLTLIAFMLILIVLAGCSPSKTAAPSAAKTPAAGKPAQAAFVRDGMDAYSAEFKVSFSGAREWAYQLNMRKSPKLLESSLHIEGVDAAHNPGDIRLVDDGERSWMTGAGTDNECITFPSQSGMDPTFLLPETFISMPELTAGMSLVGEEKIGGATVQHYRSSKGAVEPWKDATIDIWRVKSSNLLYQFTFEASGDDPFFDSAYGKIKAEYKASAQVDGEIAPVSGCEISVPLPDAATAFVRLPGMASFDSQSGVEQIVGFYQTSLRQQKWQEKDPAATKDGDTILSYQRGSETVEIHIAAADSGSKVKLIFIQQ